MASGDLSNQVPILPGGGFVKDSLIAGMPGHLPDSQQRHWIPDERDNFISWLRGEFAAANAIIDTLCHHLQLIGKPGEYDFVLTCIQQRRYNWTVVLHMQQYFSVAEVGFALQQVVWLKQALNSDHSGLPPLFVSPENGGGPQWKEGPIFYRDSRGESHIPGALHHNTAPEEQHLGRKEALEGTRKSEEHGERRRSESGDQARPQQQPAVSPSNPDSSSFSNRNQAEQAEQATTTSDCSSSDTSSVSVPPAPAQGIAEAKEEEMVADQGSHEQGDSGGNSSTKLEGSEGPSSDRVSTPYFQISSKEEEDRRLASIKLTKSYSCMEQIEGKLVNTVDGLELHGKVLDKVESNRIANLIQDIRTSGKNGGSTFAGSKKGGKGKGRELLQFGHSHHHSEDHKRRSFPKDDYVPPLPAFLEAIIDRLVSWDIIPASKRPDCCSINIMEEGDYLPPNLDNPHLERPYCILALQSECTLIFGQSLTTSAPGDFKGPLEISLPVGSVLVLQRNSADIARHSIPAAASKRIFITLGKILSTRPSRGSSNSQTVAGIAQSPPRPASTPSSNSWGPSFNHNNSNRQGNTNNNNNVQHNNSARSGGGGFGAPFKSKYAPVSSSSQSSAGGVLPNPTARPPQSAQLISNVTNSVPPIFTGTPCPPSGGAFAPPSLPIPTWSPLPRPPSRSPSAGTGVFFPSSGASSGPGRPVNMAPPRRSGNSIPSGPPLLQKTNSAPASFASLEAAAVAATSATASPPTPPGKSSKPTGTTTGTCEKLVSAAAAASASDLASDSADRGLLPSTTGPQDPNLPNLPPEKAFSDPPSDANGTKSTVKEDNPAVVRNSGRSSKASVPGNSSRTNAVSS